MAEIEEIPLESEEAKENTQDLETIEEEKPAQKKRGRPAGAKNKPRPPPVETKAKPKPKTKATKKIQHEEWGSESDEEEALPDEEPPRRRRAAVLPNPELDRHALAADVLGILQQQRYESSNARRNHYASWFANM